MRSERQMHEQFMAWLKKQSIPYRHDRMDKATVTTCGEPDFAVYWNGQVAFVEFKFNKGKLSPAQEKRITELETAGCAVIVARSLIAAVEDVTAALGLGKAAGGAPAKPDEPSAPASPKLWLAKSRDLGMVVVQRNPQTGAMGFVRIAKPEDMELPTWSELMS